VSGLDDVRDLSTAVVAARRRDADPVLVEFADEVGATDRVVAVGGRTQWSVGGEVESGVREVRAPSGVVAHEPAELIVRVRAGTTVAELDAELAARGQTVALPPWEGATVGGVLAVGHSGIRRLGWGPVRDAVLEVRAVDAGGRLLKAGGPVVKNVSGYDLCRLLVGSLGTLALIGEVVLRTRPLPAASVWVSGEADPFALVQRLHRPSAVLWDGVTTWVLLEGHPGDVASQVAAAGLSEVAGPPPLPSVRHSVPPGELSTLRAGDGGGFVAEVGAGVVHQHAAAPTRTVEPVVRALHGRLKAAFDPAGRFAPGRDVLAV
jgi:glycolate oxidase FAD binding subunit